MRGWDLALDLRSDDEQPIFLRLARAISDEVRRGRLRPGDALPGSRTLARSLGIHRNTVLAAYAELSAEGWISSEQAAGTFVSPALPDVQPRRSAGAPARTVMPARTGFDLRTPPPPGPPHLARDTLARASYAPVSNHGSKPSNGRSKTAPPPERMVLWGGVPDVRLLPTAPLARAYRR